MYEFGARWYIWIEDSWNNVTKKDSYQLFVLYVSDSEEFYKIGQIHDIDQPCNQIVLAG